jgi:ferredoxin
MAEEKELRVKDIKKLAEEKKKCPLQKAFFYVDRFLEGPMCGKCFPCEMGAYEALIRLRNIMYGRGTEEDIPVLKHIASHMTISSRCKRGKDTAAFLTEWLNTDIFETHIHGMCPERECISFIQYRIIPDECTMWGECKKACKFNAIHGEVRKSYLSGYLPFEIRQRKCTKCGECIAACPEGAIEITDSKAETEVPA